jgi:hypothetical protein
LARGKVVYVHVTGDDPVDLLIRWKVVYPDRPVDLLVARKVTNADRAMDLLVPGKVVDPDCATYCRGARDVEVAIGVHNRGAGRRRPEGSWATTAGSRRSAVEHGQIKEGANRNSADGGGGHRRAPDGERGDGD